jgi:cell division protein FtsI (penicillin-binding protein 3)
VGIQAALTQAARETIMITDEQRHHSALTFIALCILYGIILCNLFFTQIYNHTFFVDLARQQYNVIVRQNPDRALMYDRHGNVLALNKECISAFIIPIKLHNPTATKEFLATHFEHAATSLTTHQQRSFMFIKRRLLPAEIELIQNAQLPDIHLIQEDHRFYPYPACASLVGITDIDNNGALGIEKIYNTVLQGEATTFLLQKDARSGFFYLKKKVQNAGHDGKHITLCIDADLSYLADRCLQETAIDLNATKGSVTIMDPDKGDILAAATYPSFDPNNSRTLRIEHTKNNALTECYEPGSIMKIFTALAALDEHVVAFDEPINCKGTKTALVDGRTVNTWKAFGIIPFYDVIAYSNNIGIAAIAQRLKTKLFDHYTRVGFGTKTALNFPGEPSGFVNSPAHWSKQSAISLSYGYELTGTPLQFARAFSLLCNGGYLVEPRLLADSPLVKKGPFYSKELLGMILDMLRKTTTYGTTRKAAIPGYDILAKTGSASTLVDGHYTDDIGNYTCAGIIHKGTYQRVIVVHLHIPNTKKQYASTLAAPLFRKVAEQLLIHDKIV